MKKGKLRRFTAFLLAFAMIMSLMPITVLAEGTQVSEEEAKKTVTASKDGITVTKKADFTSVDGNFVDENGNPYVKIDFNVNVGDLKTETQVAGSTDIVLVIDKSGRMTTDGSQKMANAKKAAKQFIGDVLNIKGATVRVGIVAFSEYASDVAQLSSNAETLKTAVDNISSSGGTFLQGGIYYGQNMLKNSNADNKIMIVLGDGLPTYRYEFNKNYYYVFMVPIPYEDKKTESITANLASVSPYTAYTNFNYENRTGAFDQGGTDKNWSDLGSDVKLGYESTISQAYLARKEIPGLSIYSIGYGIESGKSAERIFEYIADAGKYSLAANENDLDGVIAAITKSVTASIEGVTLRDKIPSQMEIVDGQTTTHADIQATETDGGIEFKWTKKLTAKTSYNASFITTLDLSRLSGKDFENEAYYNTNGTVVEKDGQGVNSSVLVYGTKDNEKIELNSPQLKIESNKYEVHYLYDEDGDGEYETEDTSKKVEDYAWIIPNVPTPSFNVTDKNKDPDIYEKVDIKINDADGQFGNLTINEDKVVNVYYKKIAKKDIVIKKVWDDNNNQDGLRTPVTAVLKDSEGNYAKNFKDTVVGENIVLNEGNNWTVRLTDLSASEEYSVLEMTSVAGYVKSGVVSSTKIDEETGKEVTTYTITNSHTPDTCNVNVVVEWVDDDNRDGLRPPNGATVKLYKQVGDGQKVLEETRKVKSTTTFENLPVYENGNKITYIVEQDTIAEYTTTPDHKGNGLDFKFINTHVPDIRDVVVKKVWNGGTATDIEVQLLNDGQLIQGKTAVLTASNGYTYTFEDLPVKEGGKVIPYSVQETKVPDGYTVSYSEENDVLIVTNTYGQDKETSVTVNKVWNDGGNVDGNRPSSIKVTLKATVSEGADAIQDREMTITGTGDSWTDTFNNLKKYDSKGVEVKYTVEENTVSGYTTTYSGNGTNTVKITNSYTPQTRNVTVNKVWVEDDEVASLLRPSEVTIQLYQNGQEYETAQVSGEGDTWSYTFEGLPVNYLKDGKSTPIVYTVAEISNFKNYSKKVEGLTITNTYNPEETSHTVEKVWNDNDNHDGKRPDAITVTLYGETDTNERYLVRTVTYGKDQTEGITDGDVVEGWNYTFNNLPLYTEAGEEITYSVVETKVSEYNDPSYDTVTNDSVTTITNTRVNEVIDFTVTKNWEDDSNRDGKRPESITVQLLNRGQVVSGEDKTLSGNSDTWTATWEELEVYSKNAEGGVIENEYTVREVLSDEYDELYDTKYSKDGNSMTITNSYTPELTSLTVNKKWIDANNQDGYRPDEIQVQLYAGNSPYGIPLH